MKGLQFTWPNLKKKLNLKFDKIQNGTGKVKLCFKCMLIVAAKWFMIPRTTGVNS